MALIVEDGTGVADANSYLDQTTFEDYAESRGYDISAYSDDEQIEAALIRATDWIDATYRSRWPGVRSNGTDQGLMWPRKAGSISYGEFYASSYLTTVTDAEGLPIAVDAIPVALVRATAEAAYRELVSPNSLAPDLKRGGAIRSLRAGSVAIEYASTAPAGTTFSVIDNMLSSIISTGSAGAYTGRAVRA